jgi:hypothetical protein
MVRRPATRDQVLRSQNATASAAKKESQYVLSNCGKETKLISKVACDNIVAILSFGEGQALSRRS